MKNIIAKIFILLGIVICASLSFWQIKRMEYKEDLIQELKDKLTLPTTKLSDLDSITKYIYQKVEICGNYSDTNLFVYYKPDYIILSPFIVNGTSIMVAKGTLSPSETLDSGNIGNHCIKAIVTPSEKKPLFMPETDGTRQKPMLSVNIDSISELLSIKLPSVYMILLDKSGTLKPMKVTDPAKIYNNHLEYAITWGILALILAFMAFIPKK